MSPVMIESFSCPQQITYSMLFMPTSPVFWKVESKGAKQTIPYIDSATHNNNSIDRSLTC